SVTRKPTTNTRLPSSLLCLLGAVAVAATGVAGSSDSGRDSGAAATGRDFESSSVRSSVSGRSITSSSGCSRLSSSSCSDISVSGSRKLTHSGGGTEAGLARADPASRVDAGGSAGVLVGGLLLGLGRLLVVIALVALGLLPGLESAAELLVEHLLGHVEGQRAAHRAAVDEEVRRARDPVLLAQRLVVGELLLGRLGVPVGHKLVDVEPELGGHVLVVGLGPLVLVGEQQVVHLEELALVAGRDRSPMGALGVLVHR